MNKIRILFVLASLGGGGAERLVLNLARHIDREAFEVHLALLDCRGDYMRLLPGDVVLHDLKVKRVRYAFPLLAKLIRKIRPGVLFSTVVHVDQGVCLALKLTQQTPKLLFRSPTYFSKSMLQMPFYTRRLAEWSYNRADAVIASTQAMAHDLETSLAVDAKKIAVIPNPVDIELIKTLAAKPVQHPWFQQAVEDQRSIILAMGRLSEVKGFSYLLEAFARVRKNSPARLVILGKGEQLKRLQAIAEDLGIDQDVAFLGFRLNPYKYVANSDLFVLSSLREGFPNALVEAMACGIPVVSTDCLSGPSEIITPELNGLLVPVRDPEALAETILRVLADKKLAKRLAESSQRRAKDFDASKVVGEYEKLFRAMGERGHV